MQNETGSRMLSTVTTSAADGEQLFQARISTNITDFYLHQDCTRDIICMQE